MNETTRKQLETTTPAATRPVDKLWLTEAPATTAPGAGPSNVCGCACICFADDE